MNLKILLNCCLIEINKINKSRHPKYIKKIKYNDEYYLIMIYYMLNDVNNWKFLSNLKLYKSNYKYHYKTIYNKFRLWTSLNVFENAFKNYNTTYKTNLLLIDATSNVNKYGSEYVVMNPEYRKKNVTKLSLIVNENGFIYSIIYFDIKNNNQNYLTSVHDVKMINGNLNNMIKVSNKSKYFYLLGDKAYKTQEKFKLNSKIVKIITPNKKNTRNKNSKFLNKKLKKRTKVENVNCSIKKQERVMVRKDRKIKYYMSFVYIASLMNNIICK